MPNIINCSLEGKHEALQCIVDVKGLVDFSQLIVPENEESGSEAKAWGARMNTSLYGHILLPYDEVFFFSTAWVEPFILIEHLSSKFPNDDFILCSECEGVEVGNCYVFNDGKIIRSKKATDSNSLRMKLRKAIINCDREFKPSSIFNATD